MSPVERSLAGWRAARIAEELEISRATVYKWMPPRGEGWAGLVDRSSRTRRSPARTSAAVEARVLALRRTRHRGSVFLAGELGLVASTAGRILARHNVPALSATDPITGAPVRRRHSGRRYELSRPGELLHIGVKKLGWLGKGQHDAQQRVGWVGARGRARLLRRSDGRQLRLGSGDDRGLVMAGAPAFEPVPGRYPEDLQLATVLLEEFRGSVTFHFKGGKDETARPSSPCTPTACSRS